MFQSALMLTEVLKEREAQLELKRLKDQAGHGQDKEYLEQAQRELEEGIRSDQAKAAERMLAAKENQHFLKAQYVYFIANFFTRVQWNWSMFYKIFSPMSNLHVIVFCYLSLPDN